MFPALLYGQLTSYSQLDGLLTILFYAYHLLVNLSVFAYAIFLVDSTPALWLPAQIQSVLHAVVSPLTSVALLAFTVELEIANSPTPLDVWSALYSEVTNSNIYSAVGNVLSSWVYMVFAILFIDPVPPSSSN